MLMFNSPHVYRNLWGFQQFPIGWKEIEIIRKFFHFSHGINLCLILCQIGSQQLLWEKQSNYKNDKRMKKYLTSFVFHRCRMLGKWSAFGRLSKFSGSFMGSPSLKRENWRNVIYLFVFKLLGEKSKSHLFYRCWEVNGWKQSLSKIKFHFMNNLNLWKLT